MVGACADIRRTPTGFAIEPQWLFCTNDGLTWHAILRFDGSWALTNLSGWLGIGAASSLYAMSGAGSGGSDGHSATFFAFTGADGSLLWSKRLPDYNDQSWTGEDPGTRVTNLTQKLGIPGAINDVAVTSLYAGQQPE